MVARPSFQVEYICRLFQVLVEMVAVEWVKGLACISHLNFLDRSQFFWPYVVYY